ncbi:hypothetical protein [Aporhodopirellula aestuarii]|uniref:Uncharacterized protein n=1 Tax=Aporhodopirellula aestuarii TaxID=2950107 RepID=A0ABT0TWM2_9BACT|nr:hypothetical protein [Aporhodopirellula aestuarii]MCM2369005.1 hypothetical protein [Aporhodopirellula aestuarii]
MDQSQKNVLRDGIERGWLEGESEPIACCVVDETDLLRISLKEFGY